MVAFRVHPSCNPTCFTGTREVQIQSMQPWLRNTVTWGCAAQNKFGGLLALWPHTSLSHSAQKVQTLMWSTRTNISRANSPAMDRSLPHPLTRPNQCSFIVQCILWNNLFGNSGQSAAESFIESWRPKIVILCQVYHMVITIMPSLAGQLVPPNNGIQKLISTWVCVWRLWTFLFQIFTLQMKAGLTRVNMLSLE